MDAKSNSAWRFGNSNFDLHNQIVVSHLMGRAIARGHPPRFEPIRLRSFLLFSMRYSHF